MLAMLGSRQHNSWTTAATPACVPRLAIGPNKTALVRRIQHRSPSSLSSVVAEPALRATPCHTIPTG